MLKAQMVLKLCEGVAEIILQQLGGSKFIAMTGAKNFVKDDNSLAFKIPKNVSKANYVKIELMPSDTYNVTFQKDFTVLKKYEDVYADSLQDIFTDYTGMDTHL